MHSHRPFAAGLAAWLATVLMTACAGDGGAPKEPNPQVVAAAAAEAANDRAQQDWGARRQEAQRGAEAQAAVLAQARAQLLGKKPLGIQRDAAICFQARRLMDSRLDQAMRSGGEFGPALDTWHAQSRGVETFCAYALTVGAPK